MAVNLLSDNQASGTDTLGNTTGFSLFQATLSSSTDWAANGSKSLKVVATTVSGASASVQISASPKQVYTASITLHQGVGTRTQTVTLRFLDSGFANIGQVVGPSTSSDLVAKVTGTAPVNTVYVTLDVSTTGGAINDSFYADNWGIWEGSNGNWDMPGNPIDFPTLADQLLVFYAANVSGPNQTLYKPKTLDDWEFAWLKQNGGTRPTNSDMQMQLYSKVTDPLRPAGFTYT